MVESKLNLEALENYTQSFSTIILNRFFKEKTVITGQEIVNVTPIKQVNFFVLKVLFNQWQDETSKFKSPFFDYESENVKHALKNLVNTMSKHISINKEDFSPLLQKAVKDTLKLIYEPEKYFLLEANQLKDHNLDVSFGSLSRYIKIRKNSFHQITNELADGGVHHNSTELDSLIREACQQNGADEIDNEINLFNRVLPMDVLEAADLFEPTLEPINIAEEETQDTVGEPNEFISMDEEFDPLEMDSNEEVSDVSEEKEELPTNINEQFVAEPQTVNKQFEQQEKPTTVVEKHQTEKVSELHSSISVNQRYLFLNNLFNGDVNEYNKVIEDIENLKSFDSSVEYLMQNYSRKYQWDMGSDEVKELLKVIFKRFR